MAKSMTPEHKEALAHGRAQSRAVRRYLDALDAQQSTRTRQRDPEVIQTRLDDVRADLQAGEESSIRRLQLIQERIDLEAELDALQALSPVDLDTLENDFVAHAAGYSEAKGISYASWREFGVPAATLKRAGIAQTRRTS